MACVRRASSQDGSSGKRRAPERVEAVEQCAGAASRSARPSRRSSEPRRLELDVAREARAHPGRLGRAERARVEAAGALVEAGVAPGAARRRLALVRADERRLRGGVEQPGEVRARARASSAQRRVIAMPVPPSVEPSAARRRSAAPRAPSRGARVVDVAVDERAAGGGARARHRLEDLRSGSRRAATATATASSRCRSSSAATPSSAGHEAPRRVLASAPSARPAQIEKNVSSACGPASESASGCSAASASTSSQVAGAGRSPTSAGCSTCTCVAASSGSAYERPS